MAVLKDSMKVSEAILAKADSIQKAGAAMQTLMEAARGGDADARTKMEMRTSSGRHQGALGRISRPVRQDHGAFPQGRAAVDRRRLVVASLH
jgi:hypothetical protein